MQAENIGEFSLNLGKLKQQTSIAPDFHLICYRKLLGFCFNLLQRYDLSMAGLFRETRINLSDCMQVMLKTV